MTPRFIARHVQHMAGELPKSNLFNHKLGEKPMAINTNTNTNTNATFTARLRRQAYAKNGEPKGDGPRCATCGALAAWGRHMTCRREYGCLVVAT